MNESIRSHKTETNKIINDIAYIEGFGSHAYTHERPFGILARGVIKD